MPGVVKQWFTAEQSCESTNAITAINVYQRDQRTDRSMTPDPKRYDTEDMTPRGTPSHARQVSISGISVASSVPDCPPCAPGMVLESEFQRMDTYGHHMDIWTF